MYRVRLRLTHRTTIQTVFNLLMSLAFTVLFLFTLSREAHALCPNCDTTAPGYGNSSWDHKYQSGKSQMGDGRTPYDRPESNIERYNREYQKEQEAREERQRQQHYGSSGNYGSQGAYGSRGTAGSTYDY